MSADYSRKRRILEVLINENPTLQGKPVQALREAYEHALSQEEEAKAFPKDRRYTFEQSLEDGFEDDSLPQKEI